MNDKREILTAIICADINEYMTAYNNGFHGGPIVKYSEIADEIIKHSEDIPDSPCPHVMTCGCGSVCNEALRVHMDAIAIQDGKEYDPISQRFIDAKPVEDCFDCQFNNPGSPEHHCPLGDELCNCCGQCRNECIRLRGIT